MAGARTGKDIYKGCEPKQLEAVWLIAGAIVFAIIYGIFMFTLTHTSPSGWMTDFDKDGGVVVSRTDRTAATSKGVEK